MLTPVLTASGRPRSQRQRHTMTAAVVTALLALAACDGSKGQTAGPSPAGSAPVSAAAPKGEKVTINWFVGLGTGADQGQPAKQQKVVDAFNASQNEIELKMTVVANINAAKTLATQISGGKGPDIVGPVGIRGSNQFEGQWLDLTPLVGSQKFDTSIFDSEAMKSQTDIDGNQVALPFGVFPSMIWFNKDLFDEAGLEYPPQKHGEKYADGSDWDWNKLRELAKKLTVDAAGKDATDPAFNPDKVVQWGFHSQFSENNLQRNGTLFGAGSFGAEDKKTAQVPPQWLEGWKFRHDMIWKDHSAPNAKQLASDTLNKGNAFQTGKVAMATTHLWYTCCVKDSKDKALTFWDVAAVPSYNGKITAPLHSDSFRILKSSKNPEAAFKVLTYFLTTATPDLLKIYGAMPANKTLQDAFFASLDETWTQKPNWGVVKEALNYPDIPNHESWTPMFTKTEDRAAVLGTKINTDPNLDLDAEAKKLTGDLQKIFDAAK
jgi:multiple sugar transport system substrate-binding protein